MLLNGPNLNLLGKREPQIYGYETLSMIEDKVKTYGQKMGFDVACHQDNSEGNLINYIHQAKIDNYLGLIINPGAYSHTSIALHDAIIGTELNTIEVHLSNIHAREEFRHQSYISKVAKAIVCGFGSQGYIMAIQYFIKEQS